MVALAAARALQFGSEIGIHQAAVERDLVVVMNSLKNESRDMASYGMLIQDAKVFSVFYSKFSTLIQRGKTTRLHIVWLS